ncbi:pancreatic lipase-related protein 2-like [Amblyomma americanum]
MMSPGMTSLAQMMMPTSRIKDMPEEEVAQLYECLKDRASVENCSKSRNRRSKRSLWSLQWILQPVVIWAKDMFFEHIAEHIKQKQGKHTCYEGISCFHPVNRTGVEIGGPQHPEKIGTRIKFFHNRTSKGVYVSHTNWTEYYNYSNVDVGKPLFCLTHGFTRDRNMTWMYVLKDALFEKVNCNVIIVEWIEGAMFPNYAAAAANTPLPGVLLSLLLHEMMQSSNCSLLPADVHIIGFSLGAHVAGFCGRHFNSTYGFLLGRITGLDPAGPLFENSNVSLSRTDAEFVDVIHTNAGKLERSKLGLNESIGHVDFYPNGGSDQEVCKSASKGIRNGDKEDNNEDSDVDDSGSNNDK